MFTGVHVHVLTTGVFDFDLNRLNPEDEPCFANISFCFFTASSAYGVLINEIQMNQQMKTMKIAVPFFWYPLTFSNKNKIN